MYNTVRERRLDDRGPVKLLYGNEESPSTAGQGCQLTAGGGDSKASATERYRQSDLVRVERCGKSAPAAWRLVRHVNPIRCKMRRHKGCPSASAVSLERIGDDARR